ncbi:MAG: hypothetical protein ACLUIR_08910 [Faecalibacterium prausnitzii]
MFQSMLTEGKPYPEYASTPNPVRLTLRSTMENQSFCVLSQRRRISI